jgi:hypothetical protein
VPLVRLLDPAFKGDPEDSDPISALRLAAGSRTPRPRKVSASAVAHDASLIQLAFSELGLRSDDALAL